jgi:hypothetical protein
MTSRTLNIHCHRDARPIQENNNRDFMVGIQKSQIDGSIKVVQKSLKVNLTWK